MAGTDLQQGTGTQPEKVITHDGNGNIGDGEGNEIPNFNVPNLKIGGRDVYQGVIYNSFGGSENVDLSTLLPSGLYILQPTIYSSSDICFGRFYFSLRGTVTFSRQELFRTTTSIEIGPGGTSSTTILEFNFGGSREKRIYVTKIG